MVIALLTAAGSGKAVCLLQDEVGFRVPALPSSGGRRIKS